VEGDSKFEIVNRCLWQNLVESLGLRVELQKKCLVNKVQNHKVKTSNWVKQWHSARIRHDTPKGSELLSIYEESFDFRAKIDVI
jgi:hypothetical protein